MNKKKILSGNSQKRLEQLTHKKLRLAVTNQIVESSTIVQVEVYKFQYAKQLLLLILLWMSGMDNYK